MTLIHRGDLSDAQWEKLQPLLPPQKVQAVQTKEVSADELWSFVAKNRSNVSLVN